ncbi:MAG: hypothetical protein A2V53_03860 [Deltaproteobacteria bacterium RBG_19FT_COMBO_56_10]|nr:MAG: hypothetical protein A2V53_03860 [Deltaproteobacteria bacterium RBG_19FT_COMBO_56_10]
MELRARGDETIARAYDMAKKLSGLDGSNPAIDSALSMAQSMHAELLQGRKRADASMTSYLGRGYDPGEWSSVITSFIEANSEIRAVSLSAGAKEDAMHEAMRLNAELKNAAWLVAEYAGRERALVAKFVTARAPIDPGVLETLKTNRAIVDINLKPILRLRADKNAGPDVLNAISGLESTFLGSFEQTRKTIFAASRTGDYPVNGKQWIEKSSEAINSILGVSAAIGKLVDSKIAPELKASKRHMALSLTVMVVVIVLGAASIVVINKKVINPMLSLKDKMAAIERSGDLTVKIEASSADENGQMAESFNRMMDRFHGVVREIHASVDYLASSSGELSSAASRIADGSNSQSARAAQVSTASQEMSSTIAEITRSVSYAAEAAKAASEVAENGGRIVVSTIESMNGISKTAKLSSGIISSLGGRSREIGSIITVIDDIADQTNLLALNAAIEAARAGEQGRGFAVVADEVRRLAEKTMKATKEIDTMIRTMQDETGKAIESMENEVSAVGAGARLAEEAGASLNEIVSRVEVVTSMIESVMVAIQQQHSATEQISSDMEGVSGVVSETSHNAGQIAGASREIAALASSLKKTVGVFKVSRGVDEDLVLEHARIKNNVAPLMRYAG